MKKIVFYLITITFLYSYPVSAENDKTTGLPLPRFASIKADEANMRKGPGEDYHIIWTFKKKNYPVKIIAEYKNWRKIKDHYNHVGWIHKALLIGKKSAMIENPKHTLVPLLDKPRKDANVIGYAEPFSIGSYTKCKGDYCVMEFNTVTGWVNKNFIWGIIE